MKNVENVILKNIEQNGKLSTSDIEKIKQISEQEGKGLVKILRDENLLNDDDFMEILSDIYRRGHVNIDEISKQNSKSMDEISLAAAHLSKMTDNLNTSLSKFRTW